jgi:hypothetical protein
MANRQRKLAISDLTEADLRLMAGYRCAGLAQGLQNGSAVAPEAFEVLATIERLLRAIEPLQAARRDAEKAACEQAGRNGLASGAANMAAQEAAAVRAAAMSDDKTIEAIGGAIVALAGVVTALKAAVQAANARIDALQAQVNRTSGPATWSDSGAYGTGVQLSQREVDEIDWIAGLWPQEQVNGPRLGDGARADGQRPQLTQDEVAQINAQAAAGYIPDVPPQRLRCPGSAPVDALLSGAIEWDVGPPHPNDVAEAAVDAMTEEELLRGLEGLSKVSCLDAIPDPPSPRGSK